MTALKTADSAYPHLGAHNVYYVKLNMEIRTPAWPAVLMLLTSSFFLFLWQFKTSSRSRYMNSVLMAAP